MKMDYEKEYGVHSGFAKELEKKDVELLNDIKRMKNEFLNFVNALKKKKEAGKIG